MGKRVSVKHLHLCQSHPGLESNTPLCFHVQLDNHPMWKWISGLEASVKSTTVQVEGFFVCASTQSSEQS